MHWLHSLDINLFLFTNRSLVNPFFDWLMPILSGSDGAKNALIAVAVLTGIILMIVGKKRERVCVVMVAIIVGTNDGLICNTLKHAINRPRPFVTLPEARMYGQVGKGYIPPIYDKHGVNLTANFGSHNSMPSSHAANWFAATMSLFLFYRKSLWFTLPMALAVSFSRLYNGVHYPSDLLAGAIIGAGYAVAAAVAMESAWQFVGRKWLPRWHEKLPVLVPNLKLGGVKTG